MINLYLWFLTLVFNWKAKWDTRNDVMTGGVEVTPNGRRLSDALGIVDDSEELEWKVVWHTHCEEEPYWEAHDTAYFALPELNVCHLCGKNKHRDGIDISIDDHHNVDWIWCSPRCNYVTEFATAGSEFYGVYDVDGIRQNSGMPSDPYKWRTPKGRGWKEYRKTQYK